MDMPNSIFVGFFPKITAQKDDWLKNKVVLEICAVSDCISKGPENWINHWKHNDLGFYDNENLALEIISDNPEKFDLYAFKLFPLRFDLGKVVHQEFKSNAVENLNDYHFLGYDIVSRAGDSFFECSPLSCNYACEKYTVNKHCLMDSLDDAYKACVEIEQGNYEPGPYHLLEVYRKNVK